MEQKRSIVEEQLNLGDEDYDKLIELGQQLESLKEQILNKEDRWLELSEKAE